jgi:hypothetical protein
MCGIIEEDYFKRQDQRWYQQMPSGTQIADNVHIGTWVFIDMYPKSKPPKAKPRFHGLFIILKTWTKVLLSFVFRMAQRKSSIWTKDFVQSEKKDMNKSSALVPATRTQVTDEENQVSQIGSVAEGPQAVRMEEEESEISLFSDTVTQDTEMSEPPSN